ncbi:flavin reductase family protein [Amylibacter sp.]|nr:flavin reductase family protein [Amylibacter sp.]
MKKLDPKLLRNAFGKFMTGVTVVTAVKDDGKYVGFTANSFSSVSLDPPMLLVCPGKFLSSYDTFSKCDHFSVNILSEGQEKISNIFATSDEDRFLKVPHSLDMNGVPIINGATVQFSCSTRNIIPTGDHCVLIGQVDDFKLSEEPGLGYVGGQYFSLGLERAAFNKTVSNAICGAIIEDGENIILIKSADGLHPPQCKAIDRSNLIKDLNSTLIDHGISAKLGQAYSVFEGVKSREHSTYFLATGNIISPSPEVILIPISQLNAQKYSSPAISRMMSRFSLEAQSRNFCLYLGDVEKGSIHDTLERN